MKLGITFGKWRFSSVYCIITVSPEGIVEGSKTICEINSNVSFDYDGKQAIANALAIAEVPSMLNVILKSYVFHQKKSRRNVEYAIETEELRAFMRNTLASALDVDCQVLQEWVEQIASVDVSLEEVKFN